jgi:hypothetical protein
MHGSRPRDADRRMATRAPAANPSTKDRARQRTERFPVATICLDLLTPEKRPLAFPQACGTCSRKQQGLALRSIEEVWSTQVREWSRILLLRTFLAKTTTNGESASGSRQHHLLQSLPYGVPDLNPAGRLFTDLRQQVKNQRHIECDWHAGGHRQTSISQSAYQADSQEDQQRAHCPGTRGETLTWQPPETFDKSATPGLLMCALC